MLFSLFAGRPSKYETTSKKNCHVSQSGYGYPQYIRPSYERLRDVLVHNHCQGRGTVLWSRGVRSIYYVFESTFVKSHT